MIVENESENDIFERIWNQIEPELLTPKVFLERSWELNGGSTNHYCYLARLFPKFRLGALKEGFEAYLARNGVSHDQTTTVGGRHHRYERKPVLELKRFKINPQFIRGNVRNIYSHRLTFRASWLGFTAVFWVRAVCITVYKNYELDDPEDFISRFLTDTINYPKFVVEEAIEKGKTEFLLKQHDKVKLNNLRGWRIEL
ncbi:MAG: hypothetical protein GF364_01030 [Candidatus Lokiarchaeota archaeon]|nr:hypothetical protein [Candidatus Lokiarchaeota archaeon]